MVLDCGHVVKAGVLFPTDCLDRMDHYLLIIGHDGRNRFAYWNTVQNEVGPFGACFGVIAVINNKLRMIRRYHVGSLQPLPPERRRTTSELPG
jgi:hypothetical protein